jgi:hypothetical protein
MNQRTANVIHLQTHPDGVAGGLRSVLDNGRFEVFTAGPNPEFGFIGSDPYGTNNYTGLVVPPIPSSANGGARYLFMLARASFGTGEQSSDYLGVRLVGIRQYAELIARIPAGSGPLGSGPPAGSTVTFRKEIRSPLWHPPDGDISWHVMILPKTQRDTRHPANADGQMYQDSLSPAVLFQTPVPYAPPNAGRPWGKPLAGALGNIHELRYNWRDRDSSYVLDVPIPVPCDIALFASVRQNDPTLNPAFSDTSVTQAFAALSDEDKFLVAYHQYAQYGVIAGGLIFDQNIGSCVP